MTSIGWALVALAAAQEPPDAPTEASASAAEEEPLVVPEAGRIALPDVGALPSALDDDTAIEDPEDLDVSSILALWRDGRREVWAGRSILRPLVGLRSHASGTPATVGLAVGRQWWQLRDGPRLTFEALLTGETALASGLGSWSAELTVLGGGAIGPIGLQVGPAFVGDRTVLGPVTLDPVAAIAPMAQLTVDLEVVQLYGSAAPRFFVAGDRPSADVPFGDEPVLRGGLGVTVGPLRLSADWTGRWTAADRVDRFGVGARLRL